MLRLLPLLLGQLAAQPNHLSGSPYSAPASPYCTCAPPASCAPWHTAAGPAACLLAPGTPGVCCNPPPPPCQYLTS